MIPARFGPRDAFDLTGRVGRSSPAVLGCLACVTPKAVAELGGIPVLVDISSGAGRKQPRSRSALRYGVRMRRR